MVAPTFGGGGGDTTTFGLGGGVAAPSWPAVLLPGWNWVLMSDCALEFGGASGEYCDPV